MNIYYTDVFTIDLPRGHRFPLQKYRALRDAVTDLGDPDLNLVIPPAVSRELLVQVHSPVFVEAVHSGSLSAEQERAIGLPWSQGLVQRSLRSVGGTVAAAQSAVQDGLSVSLAGGTHHASYAEAAGFCVFNDVAVAACGLLQGHGAERVLIVDCDVHQGEGTAEMISGHNSIFQVSIHSARNFPHRKSVSDIDISLPDGCGDAQYLANLRDGVESALHRFKPDFMFYIAGADILAEDRLGRLGVSLAGAGARDAYVLAQAAAAQLPVAVVMGGGYAEPIEKSVAVHCQTVELAMTSWRARRQAHNTLA